MSTKTAKSVEVGRSDTGLFYNRATGALTIKVKNTVIATMTQTEFLATVNPAFGDDVLPSASNTYALGSATLMWSDLFLGSGAVINFNNGDVTVTHAANALAFAGGSSGYSFDALVTPAASDGAPLGSASLMWSDLFLASGAVVNFNNGNLTLTHSAGVLALAGSAGAKMTLTTTSASTDGGTSVEPFVMDSTLTGAGGVGGRARFQLNANAALGAWSNALKGQVVYGASGKTTGMGSAVCAEMTLSAGTVDGTYAPIEIELNLGSNAPIGTATSLVYGSINGTATAFLANGTIINLAGAGGDLFQTSAKAAINATHALKLLRAGGVAYYVPCHTSAAFGV